MGQTFNTLTSLAASAVSRSNRKKALKQIEKQNEMNRCLVDIGKAPAWLILPQGEPLGNICITGGSQQARNDLIIQNCFCSHDANYPTLILHEGNRALEQEVDRFLGMQNYVRKISGAEAYYDPIFRLTDNEIASLLVNAATPGREIQTSGILYLNALSTLLRKKGITPYLRMLASCPLDSIHSVIQNLEQAGRLTPAEASAIRNNLDAGAAARASVEYFFSRLQAEADVLAWKQHLSRCTSVAECIRADGLMAIDIDSCNKQTQLSLITAEIEACLQKGGRLRLIVDAVSLLGSDKLRNLLKNASGSLNWTLVCPDIGNLIGGQDISAWMAMSHLTVIFSHGLQTASLLSAELGEYDHIEVTQSHAGNNAIGGYGYHFSANNNISTTTKRERVVKPEEIQNLKDREFFMLDNNTATLFTGVMN